MTRDRQATVHDLDQKRAPRRKAAPADDLRSPQRRLGIDNLPRQRELPVGSIDEQDEAPEILGAIRRLKNAPRGHKARAAIDLMNLRHQRLRDAVRAARAAEKASLVDPKSMVGAAGVAAAGVDPSAAASGRAACGADQNKGAGI